MVVDFFQLLAAAILLLLLGAVEALDWVGRLDLIQARWPGLWKLLNNRPARLLLLVIAIAFLSRDFGNAAAIGGPPVLSLQQPPLVPQPKFIEPADSLRRRTKRLADDIELFLKSRQDGHPPYGDGHVDAVGEQGERNKISQAYDVETENLCLAQFRDRIFGVPREIAAKGIPVQYLDKLSAENGNLRCLYQPELDMLRGLSCLLDAGDRAVTF